MVQRIAALLAATVLLAGVVPASAQYFGRNKVQYEQFDFRVLQTPHFDIYYYPEEAEAVALAARLAERWYARLSRALGHDLDGRQPLVLYASHSHFVQTTVIPGLLGDGIGGVMEHQKGRVVMPFAAGLGETDRILGHELVHAFQRDILRRNGRSMAMLPLWFIEGMAEYLAIGRVDANTAMWLRDAVAHDRLPTIQDLDSPRWFPYRYGQALWAYLAERFGEEVVVRALRSKAAGGARGRLADATGVDVATLSKDWQGWLRSQYGKARVTTKGAAGEGCRARRGDGEGRRVGQAHRIGAAHRQRTQWRPAERGAGAQPRRHRAGVPLRAGSVLDRRLSGRRRDRRDQAPAGAHGGRPAFRQPAVHRVGGCLGSDGTPVRLLGHPAGTACADVPGRPERARAAGDHADGRRRSVHAHVGARRPRDRVLGARRRVERHLRDRPGHRGGAAADRRSVLGSAARLVARRTHDRICDRSLLVESRDAQLRAVPSRDDRRRDRRGRRAARLRLGQAHRSAVERRWREPLLHCRPRLAEQRLRAALRLGRNRPHHRRARRRERHRRAQPGAVGGLERAAPRLQRLSQRRARAARQPGARRTTLDSAEIAGLEATSWTPGGAVQPPTFGLVDGKEFEDRPYRRGLALDRIGDPYLSAGGGAFGTFLRAGMSLSFGDMLAEHSLRTAIQVGTRLDELAAQAAYVNRQSRWNWGVVGEQVPTILGASTSAVSTTLDSGTIVTRQTLVHRQVHRQVGGLAFYPFSRARRLELSGGLHTISSGRDTLTSVYAAGTGRLISEARDRSVPADPVTLVQAAAALVHDSALVGPTSPILGQRYRFEVAPTFGGLAFTTVTADYRRYVMPARPFTVALRAKHVGRYGPDAGDLRLFPLGYYLSDVVRGYDWRSVIGAACADTAGAECRMARRLGTERMSMVNLELRFPLLGVLRGGNASYGPLPLETFVFFDHAWLAGRPLAGEALYRSSLGSAGAGARVNAGGFVFEVGAARTLQGPGQGWRFSARFRPGF